MRVDVRPHLDFLDVDRLLLLAGFGRLLLGIVFEAAVIEDLADRRPGSRRYLNEVETGLGGDVTRLFYGNGSVVVAFVVDKLDFRNLDFVIDAWAFLDGGRCTMGSANGLGLLLPLNGHM